MDARFVERCILHVICVVIALGTAARTPAAKRTLSLVPRKRDDLHKSRGAAPGSQGATTEHIPHM